MDFDRLEKLMKLCKAFRVAEIEVNGKGATIIKFEPGYSMVAITEAPEKQTQPIGGEGYPTEDELLFMSSPDGAPNFKAEPPGDMD